MLDLWPKLYSAADRLYAMAPWRWLEGMEPLGVEDPVTGEIGFLHVLGQGGEHFGISRYPGAEGLRVLHALYESDLDNPAQGAEMLINSRQMQLSWENRATLEPRDKKMIKDLRLKYRGEQVWPQFRSYEPSLYPWFPTEAQGRTLLSALEQGIHLFDQLQKNPEILDGLEENQYLVRVSSGGKWRNEIKEVLPAEEKRAIISQIPSLPFLKTIPKAKACVEIDLILTSAVNGDDPADRPYFPYLLLVVNARSGMVMPGVELLKPFPSLDAMYGQVAEKVCASMVKIGAVPAEIHVQREILEGVLRPLADELGLKVKLQKHLPMLEEVAQGMAGLL